MFLFFFVKQKTAYEMRISDWSSDVCSSDLEARGELVTFGIEPTRPETGYGYIESGDPLPGVPAVRRIRRFVEKPDAATAAGYLAAGGFLWNSGIFLLPVGLFLAELERFAPRSEEHTSELQSLMRNSYAVFCLK